MDDGQRVITSKDELAKLMKRSRRQIDRWIRLGMPVLDDNCFDMVAIKQWMLSRSGTVPPGIDLSHRSEHNDSVSSVSAISEAGGLVDGESELERGSVSESLEDGDGLREGEESAEPQVQDQESGSDRYWWDKESKKYQARLRELDYRKRLGELIERSRVEDEFVARVHAVKKALIALERALPPDLIACRTEREMSEVIRKAVRNVLENFARSLPQDMQPGVSDAQA